MNEIFKDLIVNKKITVYLDNILIFSETLEHYWKIVWQVLEILRCHKLFLKPSKCTFEATTVKYLGFIISNRTIQMDPIKVEGIMEWPTPCSKRDIQQFLGFTNFYQQFICNYADHTCPLTSLTGNAEFSWIPEQQESFNKPKSLITSSPILVSPNPKLPYRVEANASEGGIGAVLSSKQGEKWHPVAYISKAMSPAEQNYEIYNKELFAIVYVLGKWRPYLFGAKHSVEILTDHQNLTYFWQPQKLNCHQARWYLELAQYDFTLTHCPRQLNTQADSLFRHPDHDMGQ